MNAVAPVAARPRRARRPGDVLARSAAGMTVGRVAASGLGFLFWLAAARQFPAGTVGVASGLVAAMMLCTQLAHAGLGPALVAAFPSWRDDARRMVAAAVVQAGGLGVAAGIAMTLVARSFFDELAAVAGGVAPAAVFAVLCGLGTANIVIDHASMAVGRGAQVLVRNLAFGAVAFTGVVLLRVVHPEAGAPWLLLPWAVAAAVACAIGAWQLHLAIPSTAPARRAGAPRSLARRAVGHHLLTLAERFPGLVLPIVVAERVGAADNAVWYPAWMLAWAVYVAPASTGVALFAAVSDGVQTRKAVETAARSVAVWSGAGALAVAVVAGPVLALLGDEYAPGAGVSRILALAVLPYAVVQVAVALCRASGRLAEATIVVACGGAAAVAAASALASRGLRAVALGWLGAQCALAVWAAFAIRRADRWDA